MWRPLPSPSRSHNEGGYSEPLSIWNQHSPRVYIAVVLCFPCDDRLRGDAVRHLDAAIRRLARSRPLFAGKLYSSGPGQVSIHRAPGYTIPFEVCATEEESRQTYERMSDEGFPPSLFINPRYGPVGDPEQASELLPVSKVQARFVPGGLLLSVFLHHSIMDGQSLGIFLECLAAQTRQGFVDYPSEQTISFSPSRHYHNSTKGPCDRRAQFKRLAAKCPEYTILPDLSGPTQPRFLEAGTPIGEIERTGKIFVISKEKLDALKGLGWGIHASSPTLPTCYCALAALTFAHVTRARRGAENYLEDCKGMGGGGGAVGGGGENASASGANRPAPARRATAQLWNSVNWRARAFQDATRDYFGNAALPAVTKVATRQLAAACEDDAELAKVVSLIGETIDDVDQSYVHSRLAMMSAAPDPRIIGVRYDPRTPEVLAFNTWRYFGADAEWQIPGVPVAKPDAIRRAHANWNLGTALILPVQANSTKQELFLSLSTEAMKRLCEDERWMRWVDRVIG